MEYDSDECNPIEIKQKPKRDYTYLNEARKKSIATRKKNALEKKNKEILILQQQVQQQQQQPQPIQEQPIQEQAIQERQHIQQPIQQIYHFQNKDSSKYIFV